MGSDLVLVASEEEWSEELIRQYIQYRQKKRRNIHSEQQWQTAKETPEYQIGKESMPESLFIMEQLTREIRNEIDNAALYRLMGKVNNRNTLHGDEIEELIEMLREAQQKLIKDGLDERKAKIRIEGTPLALCEFAVEHGYGIRLSE